MQMVSDPMEAAELLASQGALAAAMRRLVQAHPDPTAMPRETRARLHSYTLQFAKVCYCRGQLTSDQLTTQP